MIDYYLIRYNWIFKRSDGFQTNYQYIKIVLSFLVKVIDRNIVIMKFTNYLAIAIALTLVNAGVIDRRQSADSEKSNHDSSAWPYRKLK